MLADENGRLMYPFLDAQRPQLRNITKAVNTYLPKPKAGARSTPLNISLQLLEAAEVARAFDGCNITQQEQDDFEQLRDDFEDNAEELRELLHDASAETREQALEIQRQWAAEYDTPHKNRTRLVVQGNRSGTRSTQP